MGRRNGLGGFVIAAARASARASRQAEAAHRRALAANLRQMKADARDMARAEKEAEKRAKQEYLEMRIEEASELTRDSEELFQYLKTGVIPETLKIDDTINFETLRPKFESPILSIPDKLVHAPVKPKEDSYIIAVGKAPFLSFLFAAMKQKWLLKIENAKKQFENDLMKWENETIKYKSVIEKLNAEFEEKKKQYEIEYNSKCQDIEDFKNDYLALDHESVVSYISMVLERSDYTIEWEREFKLAYSPESKELLVEFRLPNFEIVPVVGEFKYVKSKDEIEEKARKKAEIELGYKFLISNIAIRTIHEIVESDQANAVSVISFNGYVVSINPSNGKVVSPTIISVSVSKTEFKNINLDKIDPIRCIQGLSASISSSPNELVAVKPIREFAMVDKRFVNEADVASTLDNRPNLMDLDPFQFENLVSNLFSKMGLETKQTRSSKDGGVDAIAFDTRPILGGKIVIQAKRYKNVVGVSAVRDLYGTMMNEGATKGILVTTSYYGPDAFDFSKDKPMELIDGGGLLYLLNQVGISAKIILPK
jgi:restriction system protein